MEFKANTSMGWVAIYRNTIAQLVFTPFCFAGEEYRQEELEAYKSWQRNSLRWDGKRLVVKT